MLTNIYSFNDYCTLMEATSGTCVIAFGRYNIPTIGHLKLMNKVSELVKQYDGTGLLFTSHTQDNEKNPLSYPEKISLLRKIVPNNVKVVKTSARRMQDVMNDLANMGFHDIVFVCGDDRVQSFKWLEKDTRFNSVKVISAGARDPESDDFTTTVSASMARKAAKDGDYKTFKKCSPFDDITTQKLYNKLRGILQ